MPNGGKELQDRIDLDCCGRVLGIGGHHATETWRGVVFSTGYIL